MTHLDNLRAAVVHPAIEYRPEQRWWLAEGLHTDATLRHEIGEAHRLGFGGMEFLAMPEESIDESRYGWGSEEWTHDSLTIAAETTARSMSFSFTSGTNWSNANVPTITPDDDAAAQELDVVWEELTDGTRCGPLPRTDLNPAYTGPDVLFERVAPTRQRFVAVVAAVLTRPTPPDPTGATGATEIKRLTTGEDTYHDRAASRTPGLDGRDAELAATMTALRALPSVAEVDDPSGTVEALRALGVRGYHEFSEPNRSVLTYGREEGDLTHVYAYHVLYETGQTTSVELRLPGTGTVHRLDHWSGRYREIPSRAQGEVTVVPLTLRPGEVTVVTLDRSAERASGSEAPGPRPAAQAPAGVADGAEPARSAASTASAPIEPEVLARLKAWQIAVESWDAGPDRIIEEDRGLGYVTREVCPTTVVTRLESPATAVAPWNDLPGVGPEVSGVGEYRTVLHLPQVPEGRLVLDLGDVNGGLGSVVVGAADPIGFDTSVPTVDVTGLLHAGDNEIVVRVSSSLSNRLRARGYYEDIVDIMSLLEQKTSRPHDVPVRSYGLVGPVRLVRAAD